MMKTTVLKLKAFQYAAGWLASDCDMNDLGSDLSEQEEEFVREWIRDEIVPMLEKRGAGKKGTST